MARKTNKPLTIGMTFGTNQISIRESANMVRWNPNSAIDTMNEVKGRTTSPIVIDYWNKTAKEINAFLDSVVKQRYYIADVFWGMGKTPRRLELVEVEMDLEDWVAYTKAIGEQFED